MTDEFPPFQRYGPCIKCGSTSISSRHHGVYTPEKVEPVRDHLERECNECSYSWQESTLDKTRSAWCVGLQKVDPDSDVDTDHTFGPFWFRNQVSEFCTKIAQLSEGRLRGVPVELESINEFPLPQGRDDEAT